MKTILVTGAFGFVGTNIAEHLNRERYSLWALDIKEVNKDLYSKFFAWREFDKIPFDQIDTIIHLAGKAHDTKGIPEVQSYFEVNTGLTQKMFDAFLMSKAKRFIFFSSVKAASDIVEGDILTEDIIPKPVGPYGESKIKAEEYILSKDIPIDKRIYIFRPCMIHGPGNKGNLNLLYEVISKGIPYPLGAFDNKRSFTSIGNLIFIIEQTLQNNIPSGIYNIADDIALSTNELISAICRVLKKSLKIWNMPKGLIFFAAKCGDFLHLPLNTFRLTKLTENYVVSNDKIKKAIGIKSLPITSLSGLEETIKSFQKK